MHGRVAVARLYHMTDGHGVRDLLAFLLARDTMHQNQWIAAARELQEEGLQGIPVPSSFPLGDEHREVSHQYIKFSDGQDADKGAWASGPTPDGKGELTYVPEPAAGVPMPPPTQPDPRLYGTTAKPNLAEKVTGKLNDTFTSE
ncbi:manganese catalase family protein [Cellulomonas sp. zg-ZUI222]|uniref:manganese catalase family protein n=1 Tax=Cellulomonas TaxID=1707 RepID=UPI001A943A62|nr:manganese catalase family protein [Cellulomonas sp. zg-ZUI22]MBO0921855.1 manganese catalase family protein [Cellulomonas wangleii]